MKHSHRNHSSKRIKRLGPKDPIPLLDNQLPEDIVDAQAFDYYLIDDSFCVGHKALNQSSPPPPLQVGTDEGYYYNQSSLVIPRHMYRIDDLENNQQVGGELASPPDGDSVRVPLIVEGEVIKIKDPRQTSFFSVDHHCTDAQVYMGGKTGGGVCGKKIGSPYVAELWKWEDQYPASETDTMRQLVHHYLKTRFKLAGVIRLVQLVLPDYNIVRIPVFRSSNDQEAKEVHKKLMKADADTVFGIDDLILLDGPDIFLGTSTFDPIR